MLPATDKINAAIRDCLQRCYVSPSPVLCLADYFQRLRTSGQWRREELMEVRSRVVRILRAVAAPDDSDELAPQHITLRVPLPAAQARG